MSRIASSVYAIERHEELADLAREREALERYLRRNADGDRLRRAALAVGGSLTDDEVAELDERTREIRESWR